MTAPPRLVFSDEWLAVVDKPAGLVVHAAPGHRGPTLVDALGEILGGGEDSIRPGIVHRLDKDTSGLMIVARTDEAHRRLSEMIRRRQVERRYLALVEGRPRSRSGTIDAPLGRDHRAPERRAVGGRGSREARTHFEVVETFPADTLVEARLETGRTHQIRAHFAAIGHPVCGDPRYGTPGRHGLERQFLHSARLDFAHPIGGEELSFASELPEDLARALQSLANR
jgi:23S rRNA pseudouridine1911/1915/1917 synthase